MSVIMQINPFEFFADSAGDPLDAGYIWIGEHDKDPRQYPVAIYYDEALTQPAAQPLRTSNGYVVRNGSPTYLYVDGNYSVLVQDKRQRQVYYVPDFLMIGSGSAVSSGDLANNTDPSKGSSLVGYIRDDVSGVGRTVHGKLSDTVSARDFGLVGDGTYHPLSEFYPSLAAAQVKYPFVSSLTQSIDWAAIQASMNYAVNNPCNIDIHDHTCITTDTLIWKGGAFLVGVRGRCSIKLNAGANCTVIESQDFDHWASWTTGMSNVGYTMDGGLDGILIDGNAGEQGDISTSLANLVYGIRIHSHRFHIGWLQVRRVKGVGILTKYNAALMFSFRVDGIDDYGLQGSPLGTPSPYEFKQINVIDSLFEAFIFEGPADIPIWHLTTNYNGWLDNATIPTTPRTSLLYPGEEIHSVRIQTACKAGYMNLNGALYGRSLYVSGFTRFHADTVIVTGSWGAMMIEGSAFGSIAALSLQQNTYAWNGDYKPNLEIKFATGSAASKNRFSFPQVFLRRLTTPPTVNSIGPGIYDNAGAQFGIIDGIDSNATPGHGLQIGPLNRGGIYESVNFDSIIGTAGDGTESAAIIIEDGSRDWRIDTIRLTNCGRGVVNKAFNMRGVIRDGTIDCNAGATTGQIALEGIVTSSQLASVTPGTGNIALDNIHQWDIELIDSNTRYYNRLNTSQGLVLNATGAFVGAAIDHNMWRTPSARDIKTCNVWGGTVWPSFNAGVRSITSSQITLAGYVHSLNGTSGTLTIGVEIL